MATRLYLPSTGAAAVSPAYDAAWDVTTGADALACVLVKLSSAMGSQISGSLTEAGVNDWGLIRQYVSAPLAAQTISGTVKSQARYLRSSGETIHDAISIRVCNNAGTSFTGTLLSLGSYKNSDGSASLRNKMFADGDALSSLAVNAGDRLVIEYGAKRVGGDGTGTINFGDDSGTDLPEDETTTAANNPWIEFSGTLVWASAIPVFMRHYRQRRIS